MGELAKRCRRVRRLGHSAEELGMVRHGIEVERGAQPNLVSGWVFDRFALREAIRIVRGRHRSERERIERVGRVYMEIAEEGGPSRICGGVGHDHARWHRQLGRTRARLDCGGRLSRGLT